MGLLFESYTNNIHNLAVLLIYTIFNLQKYAVETPAVLLKLYMVPL